jgi:hypothetical protein
VAEVKAVIRQVDPDAETTGRIKSSKSASQKERRFTTDLRAVQDKVGVRVQSNTRPHRSPQVQALELVPTNGKSSDLDHQREVDCFGGKVELVGPLGLELVPSESTMEGGS